MIIKFDRLIGKYKASIKLDSGAILEVTSETFREALRGILDVYRGKVAKKAIKCLHKLSMEH